MTWDIITYSLLALTITSAAVALVLAKLDIRDDRKKYLGFRPRDIKTYSAYISFISTILIIFLQTRKDIKANIDLIERYRFEDSTETKHFDSTLHAIDSTLVLQQNTIHATDCILGIQTIELQNQRLALDANIKLLKGQDKTLSSIQEILHPLFPLEISGNLIIVMDSLDQNTKKKINEFQNYLTTIDTSKIPKNFYLTKIKEGIFWHDWFYLGTDSSTDSKFNDLNLKVTKSIVPMLKINLHKDKKNSVNLFQTTINWEDAKGVRMKWFINKTQGLIYIDFEIQQSRLSDLSSNSNFITSFYSCEGGYLECKVDRYLMEQYKGAYLNYLVFACGQDKMDSYAALFSPKKYRTSDNYKIYSLPVKTILKN